jgi:UDP-2-acetamido-2,6-beta-L-arabino-hexul-4-ose reductase
MRIVVTGAEGFIGRHLVDALSRDPRVSEIIPLGRSEFVAGLESALLRADVIYHLAGINRPKDPAEFEIGNCQLTAEVCATLTLLGRAPTVVLSSSTQAEQDTPYGRSKRRAEEVLEQWAAATGAKSVVFRIPNVFGKWCRPNYNSVTATFCFNTAHDLPLIISDPAREIDLAYVDDVIASLLAVLECRIQSPSGTRHIVRTTRVSLGALAARLETFRESRTTLLLPAFDDEFTRRLYVTYLSYLDCADFSYPLQQRTDARGTLAEFMKSTTFGQIFVSRTNPGVTRGNHYHHSKTEKFLVLEGEAIVRFRGIANADIIKYHVSGSKFTVVDIPPGYTHSIENVGTGDLVTLFWASEIFDSIRPDTISLPVLR